MRNKEYWMEWVKRAGVRAVKTVDKDNRLITVSDNGIGMDKEDLENRHL